MFIEKLWEQYPEVMEKQIKKICGINESKGDTFGFIGADKGVLKFAKYGTSSFEVFVEDFDIKLSFFGSKPVCIPNSEEWRVFMTKVYGNNYVHKYISARKTELKNYVNKFEEETNRNIEDLSEVLKSNNTSNINIIK